MKLFSFRCILAVLFIFLVGCLEDKGSIKGYMGTPEGGSSSDGSTNPSNAVVMLPSSAQFLLTEGTSQKVQIIFNKPLPRSVTLNWEITSGEKDFEVVSGVVSAQEEAESIELDVQVKADGRYEGEEKYYLKVTGDVNVFLAPLMVPLVIQETGSPLVISLLDQDDAASAEVEENSGSKNLTVRLSAAADFTVQAEFAVTGTATKGDDYTLSESTSVTFAPGEVRKDIRIILRDDALAESAENVIITMTSVPVGNAVIDSDNKKYTLKILASDSGAPFKILGVVGGTDLTEDTYLTNGNVPTITWSDVLDEFDYRLTIKNSSNSTVCSVTVPKDVLSFSFTSGACGGATFNQGSTYKVVAEVSYTSGGPYTAASNSGVYEFVIDGTPPGSFLILGAFGGGDFEPDQYLAGSLIPTIAWQNASGEVGYRVKIYSKDSGSEVCAPQDVTANVTSYTFSNCPLIRGSWYKISVQAFDLAQNLQPATNNNFEFYVTEVASGYIISGLKGGTSDVTADSNLNDAGDANDPYSFVGEWQQTGGIERYEATILNGNNSVKCPTVTVTVGRATFSNCKLSLNVSYKLKVIGYDANNVQYPATNSPYGFIYKKGLFLSGDSTQPSYYRGIPLTSCNGGSRCDSQYPYVVNAAFQEEQIVIGKDAVLSVPSFTGVDPGPGNGVLEITVDDLRIEDSGQIQVTGKGYAASTGEGKGKDGLTKGTGAAYGGNGTLDDGGAQAKAYGSVKQPQHLGSGGGSANSISGGKGGGAIKITVNKELSFKTGSIIADGTSGAIHTGGGSGGSIYLTAKKISGVSGTLQANGGAGNGNGGPGSGGRIAIYYDEITYSGGLSGLAVKTLPGSQGGASGTYFTKKISTVGGDTYGYLIADLASYTHVNGVETPIPLVDIAEVPATSHLFNGITTKGQSTFIIEAGKNYTLQSMASPPTLDYRLVNEGDLILPVGTSFKVGSSGYLEWRKNTPVNFTDLTIMGGGVLTHTPNPIVSIYPDYLYKLDIQATNLNVFGAINVNGKGHLAYGLGVGSGVEGAAYGGQGGFTTLIANRGEVYGSIASPAYLGSGSSDARGGGIIKIQVTNDLVLTGSISANGNDGCGGGSGGSIWVVTKNLMGTSGALSSQGGGSSSGNCGGGGGGRIAVYYDSTSYAGGITGVKFLVSGGDSAVDGAAGTVYHKKMAAPAADSLGHLMVLNTIRDYHEDVLTPIKSLNAQQLNSIVTDARGTLLIGSDFTPGAMYTLPSDQITYRMVAEGDFNFPSGSHLQIADGGYLEVRRNTVYSFDKLTVNSGGFLTHTSNRDGTIKYAIKMSLVDFDLLGVVDVSRRGYPASYGPGTSTTVGLGAGYGGYGGNGGSYNKTLAGAPYGEDDIKAPNELGSGSAYPVGQPSVGATGGGLAQFTVTNSFNFRGQILADGGDGLCPSSGACAGGASGGSIYINATQITGANGTLSANGGNGGGTTGNSGSGGRIAVVYVDDSTYAADPLEPALRVRKLVDYEKIRAFGGTAYSQRTGAAGSIFFRDTDSGSNLNGDLIYNNSSNPHVQKVETLAPKVTFDSVKTMNKATLLVDSLQTYALPTNLDYRLVVEGTGTLPTDLTINKNGYLEWRKNSNITLSNLTIQSGGLLTHSYNYDMIFNDEGSQKDYRLEVVLSGNLNLNGGGSIDVSGRGYMPGHGKGTGARASHGGISGSFMQAYGDYSNPSFQGSGATGAGSGGGIARITATGTTVLNGSILSNGFGAGGSGGSIYLNTGTLQGVTGSLRADGAWDGASGGRIAILYSTDSYPIANLTKSAYGGNGYTPNGAAGTIFYKEKVGGAKGHLIVNNAGRSFDPRVTTVLPETPLDSVIVDSNSAVEVKASQTVTLPNANVSYKLIVGGTLLLPTTTDTLVIENGGVLELRKKTEFGNKNAVLGDGQVKNMIVKPLGIVRHTQNFNTYNYSVNLNLDTLELRGLIDANGCGFGDNAGPGADSKGAHHGGIGGGGLSVANESKIYGSIKNPTSLGSSSATTFYGGGLVLVDVKNFDFSGTIRANGVVGSGSFSGSSGGSVNIKTEKFIGGGGTITTQGGRSGYSSSGYNGGGGGRIAIKYNSDEGTGAVDSLFLSARGGDIAGENNFYGAAGTIFIKKDSDLNGKLVLDNGDFPLTEGVDTVIKGVDSNDVIFDEVVIGSATTGVYVPEGVIFEPKSSNVFYSLRIRGDVKFPNENAAGAAGTEHWGDVNVVNGGMIILHRDQNFGVTEKPFIYRDFVMQPGSKVTHLRNTTHTDNKDQAVYIKTRRVFEMKEQSVIDANGRGYRRTKGPGAGKFRNVAFNYGGLIGNVNFHDSISGGSGGSYGGGGGAFVRYLDNATIPKPTVGRVAEPGCYVSGDPTLTDCRYGTNLNPLKPGSGGGEKPFNSTYTDIGAGGGLVILQSDDSMILDGQILANGGAGDVSGGFGYGGGSGGSINIQTANLAGSYATLQANGGVGGGTGVTSGGGGGGGRIAIRYITNSYNGTLNYSVLGGTSFDDIGQVGYFVETTSTTRQGGVGTYYVEQITP